MVIQCPECQTRFQLADEKVKPGGIKVRCAKCKQIFPVMPSPPPLEQEPAPVAQTMPQDEPHSAPPADTGAQSEEAAKEDASEFFFDTPSSQPQEPETQEASATGFAAQPAQEKSASPPTEGPEAGGDDFAFDDAFSEVSAESSSSVEDEMQEDAFGFADAFSAEPAATDRSSGPESEADTFAFDEPSAAQAAEAAPDEESAQQEGGLGLSEGFGEQASPSETGQDQRQDELAFDSVFSEKPAAGESLDLEPEQEPEGFGFDDAFAAQPGETELDQAGNVDEFSFEEDAQSGGDDLSLTDPPAAGDSDEFSFEKNESQQDDGFSFDEEISFDTSDETPPQENDSFASDEFSFDEESDETSLSWETEGEGAVADELDFGDETADKDENEDDFDFSNMTFGEDAPETSPQVEAGDFASQAAEEFPAPEAAAAPMAAATATAPAAAAEQAGEASEPAPAAPEAKRKGPLSGLTLFLLVLLLALLGAAGYFFWSGKSLDFNLLIARLTGKQAGSAAAGQIRLSGLTSVFITNKQAGQLFVIQGQAINDYPEPRSALAVKGILFDKDGRQLMQQTVFCGNTLEQEALKNWPFGKIEESMNNQFGDSLSNLNIAPGGAIPFIIVFKNLPPNLAEFIVEPADSKPGSQP